MKRKLIFSFLILLITGISNLYATTWTYGGSGTLNTFIPADWDDGSGGNPTGIGGIGGIQTTDNIVIAGTLLMDINFTCANLTVSGGAELDIDPTIILNASNITVNGVVYAASSLINVSGDLILNPSVTVDFNLATVDVLGNFYLVGGSSISGTPTYLHSTPMAAPVPPIPVSPWAVVVGLGLIGTTVIVRRRKMIA